MADAVTSVVIHESPYHYIANFSNVSDGTGEAAVVKVDKSAIAVASDGAEAGSLEIEKIAWNTVGMAVKILWDHTTDDLGFVCVGDGMIDFSVLPGSYEMSNLKISDPRSAGATGDILFTTVGHSSGDMYSITLWLKKNPA